jgi:hypothetical protein
MPNPIKRLPIKAGRTSPSSRVKKIRKEGNRKFIGPRQMSSELAEDRARQSPEDAPLRGKPARKRTQRRAGARLDRELAARELENPYKGPPDPKVTAKSIYTKLRKNLSPDQQMMLDQLTGRFKPLDIEEDYGEYNDFNNGIPLRMRINRG